MANQKNDPFVEPLPKRVYERNRARDATETHTVGGRIFPSRQFDVAEEAPAPQNKVGPAKNDPFVQIDSTLRKMAPAPSFEQGRRDGKEHDETPSPVASFSAFPALAFLNVRSVDDAMGIAPDQSMIATAIPLQLSQPQYQPIEPSASADNTTAAAHAASKGDSRYSKAALDAVNDGGQGRVSGSEISAISGQIDEHSSKVDLAARELAAFKAALSQTPPQMAIAGVGARLAERNPSVQPVPGAVKPPPNPFARERA